MSTFLLFSKNKKICLKIEVCENYWSKSDLATSLLSFETLAQSSPVDNVEAGSQNQNASELSAALATVNVNFHIPPQNIRAASCMEFKHDKVNELIYSPEAKTQ
jgi:hypothetical protein